MAKPIISIGLPTYSGFSGEWVTQTLQMVANLQDVEVREIISVGTMTADHSRNLIAQEFLKSNAEWLFWIDSDTLVPAGSIQRMIAQGKTLVSGLYYGKNPPHNPIAYYLYNGAYAPIDQSRKWEKGEIIPVAATGFGCMLTHRSVFEDILKNFKAYQVGGGGIVVVNNNDILGDVTTTSGPISHEHDGKVYKGQLRQRLTEPTLVNLRFPFFMVEHLRTEDMHFFDLARRVGHIPYLDTSVECGHLRNVPFTGKDYREAHGR